MNLFSLCSSVIIDARESNIKTEGGTIKKYLCFIFGSFISFLYQSKIILKNVFYLLLKINKSVTLQTNTSLELKESIKMK